MAQRAFADIPLISQATLSRPHGQQLSTAPEMDLTSSPDLPAKLLHVLGMGTGQD